MNCKSVSVHLSAYIDGEVQGDLFTDIRSHLDLCGSCRREEDDLRTLKSLISVSESPRLDPEFEQRLQRWLADPDKHCPEVARKNLFSPWICGPICMVVCWLVFESINVAPANQPKPREQNVAAAVERDQVYDLTSSQPEFGAPIITAEYVR